MTNLSYTGLSVLVFEMSPDFHSWEDHFSSTFRSEEFDELAPNTGLPVPVCCRFNELRGTFWLSDLVFPGLCDAIEASTLGSLTLHRETKIHHRIRFFCDSFFTCIFLCSFRHRFETVNGTEMAYIEQTQKMIPFIRCEISLCQYVCELVLGVNVFDLDLGVQFDSIKEPIKSNSVGSGNMSHCRTPSFNDHFDHCVVVFKDVQQSFLTRRMHVWRNEINIIQIINLSRNLLPR